MIRLALVAFNLSRVTTSPFLIRLNNAPLSFNNCPLSIGSYGFSRLRCDVEAFRPALLIGF